MKVFLREIYGLPIFYLKKNPNLTNMTDCITQNVTLFHGVPFMDCSAMVFLSFSCRLAGPACVSASVSSYWTCRYARWTPSPVQAWMAQNEARSV